MYFDAHSDIWCDVTTRRLNGETNVFDRCHLERLRKGGVEGSIFVIWVDPPYDVDYVKRTEQIMAAIKAETAECRSFRIVHSYDEMMKANADGKIYIFIGIEGMAAMGKDLTWIDRYYEFGCRHGILTWNEANDLGAGALSGKDYGLTDLGRETVRRMQEKGMLLDVSHLNDAGFWDVVKITQKPFIASHSNSRAMCGVLRNLTDDQLRAIRDINGVVGLNAFNIFIDDDPKNQTVERLAEHAQLVHGHLIPIVLYEHGVRYAGAAELYVSAVEPLRFTVQVDDRGVVEPYAVECLAHSLAGDKPGGRLDALRFSGKPVLIAVARDAPRPVAAHFAETAVGIVKQQPVVGISLRRSCEHETVRADARSAAAQRPCKKGSGVKVDTFGERVYDNEVITGSVHFRKFHVDLRARYLIN